MQAVKIVKRNRLASKLGIRTKAKGNLLDGYREEAQIYNSHGNPMTYIFLSAVGGNQSKTNLVPADGAPEIGNTESRADETKNKTGDSCDERNMFHSAKPPNIEVGY